MKRLLVSLGILGAILASSIVSVGPASAAGGGTFWLFDGANSTGCARDFDIAPDRLVEFGALNYNQGPAGCTTKRMDNSVSSVTFSCGGAGFNIDDNDWIEFFDATGANGAHQTMNPVYPSECSNGLIKRNLNSTLNNAAGSMITNE